MSGFIQDNDTGGAPAPAATAERRKPGPKPGSRRNKPPAPDAVSVDAAGTEEGRTTRRVRRPFGSHSQKLAYPQRPGYHRHWFNDTPGRIDQATEGGYTHVKDDRTGENVRRPVGTAAVGGVLFAYLMEIPQEWYDEDMAAEQEVVARSEDAIKGGKVLDSQGESQGNFYNSAQGRRTSIRHGR